MKYGRFHVPPLWVLAGAEGDSALCTTKGAVGGFRTDNAVSEAVFGVNVIGNLGLCENAEVIITVFDSSHSRSKSRVAPIAYVVSASYKAVRFGLGDSSGRIVERVIAKLDRMGEVEVWHVTGAEQGQTCPVVRLQKKKRQWRPRIRGHRL
jgi:hypothetical protein